jgi:transposase
MLRPQPIDPVPEDTARIAHAVYRTGHPYLRLADELGTLVTDEDFAPLFPSHGQPALAPWRLALVSILQFAEGLSDRQAAHALRSRIDWKYVVHLELADPGFDGSVLSEFRGRLVAGAAETLLFDRLLAWCREHGYVKARGKQRTDATHVLAAVRMLNRVELVGEAMRHALDTLATVAPGWTRAVSQTGWVERYGRRSEEDRLPTGKEAREALALAIGADGYALLSTAYAPDAPDWLRHVPAVETLRRIWVQNYYRDGERLEWRSDARGMPPAADFVSSPYDLDAHYGKKGTTQWVGCCESIATSRCGCTWIQGHVVAQHLQAMDQAALDDLLIAPLIVVDAEIMVRLMVGQHMVGDDEDAMPDGHRRALLALAHEQAAVLGSQVALVAPADALGRLDQRLA